MPVARESVRTAGGAVVARVGVEAGGLAGGGLVGAGRQGVCEGEAAIPT